MAAVVFEGEVDGEPVRCVLSPGDVEFLVEAVGGMLGRTEAVEVVELIERVRDARDPISVELDPGQCAFVSRAIEAQRTIERKLVPDALWCVKSIVDADAGTLTSG